MDEIFKRQRPDKAVEWTGERLTTAVDGQVEITWRHLRRPDGVRSQADAVSLP
jgi:hypothetical protein